METVFRQIEDKGKINIIECTEDKVTRVRNVVRWICEVTPQETPQKTKKLAFDIMYAMNPNGIDWKKQYEGQIASRNHFELGVDKLHKEKQVLINALENLKDGYEKIWKKFSRHAILTEEFKTASKLVYDERNKQKEDMNRL